MVMNCYFLTVSMYWLFSSLMSRPN